VVTVPISSGSRWAAPAKNPSVVTRMMGEVPMKTVTEPRYSAPATMNPARTLMGRKTRNAAGMTSTVAM
jgi:hypothetical protein